VVAHPAARSGRRGLLKNTGAVRCAHNKLGCFLLYHAGRLNCPFSRTIFLRKFQICYNCPDHQELTLKKFKIVIAALISLLPLNGLRVLGYRLLGYRIQDARIGFGTILAVDEAVIESCKIGPFNVFAGPMKVHIQRGASIGNRNEFICGYWVLRDEYKDRHYARSLEICSEALITSRHYFDLSGALLLGERSWIAGIDSQFWTHGMGVKERDIRIGSDCYIGSGVRFSPGSSVGDDVVVAMGSVVSGEISERNALIGGVPAKVLKSNYNWQERNA
jgi:acetyltransferase-like isoleucine patch superfamily enzyme